jgi:hypothetical protein
MFIVYNYPPNLPNNGHFIEDRLEFSSILEARSEATKRLGDLDQRCHWNGYEARNSALMEVEAYHESDQIGCGGVQISMFKKLPL